MGESARASLSTALATAAAGRRLKPSQCLELAEGGDEELRQAFIQAVTIHETYFFRDPKQFELLRSVAGQHMRERPRSKVRALSAGCASGEEAYSMAAAFASAAQSVRSPPKIEVVGIDIDRKSLEKARAGCYGRWSIREAFPTWAHDAVLTSGEEWEVSDKLRPMVRFYSMNLYDSFLPLFLANDSPFDFIFTRNVLMYLVPKAATRVAHQLTNLLAPTGYLTLSPVDLERAPKVLSRHPVDPTFLSRHPPMGTGVAPPKPSSASSAPLSSVAASPAPATEAHPVRLSALPAGSPQMGQMLAEAKRLTDCGELARAKAICAELLRHYPDAPAALFLAALVEMESRGWATAETLLHGALGREPDFALAHFALATLLKRQGRTGEARARLVRLSHILAGIPPETILPGPEEITCGWLRSVVSDHLNA